MSERSLIGIVICDRYRRCAGGKCFRSLRTREGAFSRYADDEVEVVGYTTCDGCPGGNLEYAIEEMKGNGARAVHLATGLLVGYPPCPHLRYFGRLIEIKHGLEVVYGTHPIPESYYDSHRALQTWDDPMWEEILEPTLTDRGTRLAYN
jgi:predicted metal-binding protein